MEPLVFDEPRLILNCRLVYLLGKHGDIISTGLVLSAANLLALRDVNFLKKLHSNSIG
jgi:hypothetical protein